MTQRMLLLIGGESAAGKSTSLMNIPDQDRWAYVNTESGKALPFKNSFKTMNVTDPWTVRDAFNEVTGNPDFDGIIIDSLTFLMEMFERVYVVRAKDTREAWGHYANFFKEMMQDWVAKCDKHVIFLAHTNREQDAMLVDRVEVPIKGSIKKVGVESFFSTVVAAKRMNLEHLQDCDPTLLNITEDDKMLGYKHVFQTRITKGTVGERIRGPIGLFESNQAFMDNDVAKLLEHMINFYS